MKLKHSFSPLQTSTHLLSPWSLLAARSKPETMQLCYHGPAPEHRSLAERQRIWTPMEVPWWGHYFCIRTGSHPGSLGSKQTSPGTICTPLSGVTLIITSKQRLNLQSRMLLHIADSKVQLSWHWVTCSPKSPSPMWPENWVKNLKMLLLRITTCGGEIQILHLMV